MEQPPDHFERFWAVYPRRDAKKDARKAWTQIGGDQHVEAILTALGWQAAQWTERQFTPLPATYLRGERWDDEPPEARPMISKGGIQLECPHTPACMSRWACGTRQQRERQAS